MTPCSTPPPGSAPLAAHAWSQTRGVTTTTVTAVTAVRKDFPSESRSDALCCTRGTKTRRRRRRRHSTGGPVARETSLVDARPGTAVVHRRMAAAAAAAAAAMTASAERIVAFVFGRVLKGRRRAVTVVQLWRALTAGFGAAYFRRRRNVAAVRDAMEYLLYTGRLMAVAPESAASAFFTCKSSSPA